MFPTENVPEKVQEQNPPVNSEVPPVSSFSDCSHCWSSASTEFRIESIADRLDPPRPSVEDVIQQNMKPLRFPPVHLPLAFVALLLGSCAPYSSAQNAPAPAPKAQTPRSDELNRITIEVTGGDNNVPVENASVYVKYIEERKLLKDKKLELNVKTSREGIAHVRGAKPGRVLIQIVADGWKSYGRWFDIADPKQTLKVHLERPPKWY